MPIPIAIVGAVLGGGVLAVVGGIISHSDHSNHSDHADIEAEHKKLLASAKQHWKDAKEAKNVAIDSAIAAVEQKCIQKGVAPPRNLRKRLSGQPADNVDDHYDQIEAELFKEFEANLDEHFAAEIEEKTRELNKVNKLLQRIQAVQLVGNPLGQVCQDSERFLLAVDSMDKAISRVQVKKAEGNTDAEG